MTREDAKRLLSGYATGSLSESEQQQLFAAALEDQELFDELAGEQSVKELIELPGARARLLAALEPEARSKGVVWWPWAGAFVASAILSVWLLLPNRETPKETIAQTPAPVVVNPGEPVTPPVEAPAPKQKAPARTFSTENVEQQKTESVGQLAQAAAPPATAAIQVQPAPPPPQPAPPPAKPEVEFRAQQQKLELGVAGGVPGPPAQPQIADALRDADRARMDSVTITADSSLMKTDTAAAPPAPPAAPKAAPPVVADELRRAMATAPVTPPPVTETTVINGFPGAAKGGAKGGPGGPGGGAPGGGGGGGKGGAGGAKGKGKGGPAAAGAAAAPFTHEFLANGRVRIVPGVVGTLRVSAGERELFPRNPVAPPTPIEVVIPEGVREIRMEFTTTVENAQPFVVTAPVPAR